MSSITEPSTSAFFFVVDDATTGSQFDVFLDVNFYSGFETFDMRFRPAGSQDKWTFISLNSVDGFDSEIPTDLDTAEKTFAEIDRIVAHANKVIVLKFGVQERPPFGVPLILWLLKSGFLKESNNVLTFEKP
jgi:hypothetical protein